MKDEAMSAAPEDLRGAAEAWPHESWRILCGAAEHQALRLIALDNGDQGVIYQDAQRIRAAISDVTKAVGALLASSAQGASPSDGGPDVGDRVHDLKCQQPHFDAVLRGDKTCEIRLDDRHYMVGDVLRLREWGADTEYTGRECYREVTHITTYKQEAGLVVLSIAPLRPAIAGASPSEPERDTSALVAELYDAVAEWERRYNEETCRITGDHSLAVGYEACADRVTAILKAHRASHPSPSAPGDRLEYDPETGTESEVIVSSPSATAQTEPDPGLDSDAHRAACKLIGKYGGVVVARSEWERVLNERDAARAALSAPVPDGLTNADVHRFVEHITPFFHAQRDRDEWQGKAAAELIAFVRGSAPVGQPGETRIEGVAQFAHHLGHTFGDAYVVYLDERDARVNAATDRCVLTLIRAPVGQEKPE